MFGKPKYIVILIRNKNNMYYRLKKKKIKDLTEPSVRYKKKTYLVHLKHPTLIQRSKFYYFIDVDENRQYNFTPSDFLINPKDLDIYLSRSVISNLVSGLQVDKPGLALKSIILGGAIGVLSTCVVFLSLLMGGVI
ncbi:MAG: hypothetical protein GF317_20015 [Candidatus Lokiarchaeota archaeon]|nr:hypothetical protein [Candidatus Lokiarchaeota archaeon]